MSAETTTGSSCPPDHHRATGSRADTAAGGVTVTYRVNGMTCGHCEGAVSEELSAVEGVSSVKAVASTGLVTIVSAAPLDEQTVRAAIDEAGYELVGTA